MNIPLAKPSIDESDIASVRSVIEDPSGQLALGPKATAFEALMAETVHRKHALCVNSGTSALHLIIRALGIGPGDEVITTPFSFVASTNCILMERATPVFVDIDPGSLCVDPAQVEAAITPKTKAILAVDVFGHPANWPALSSIAESRGLALIEDSAESLGSTLAGIPCGSFGCAAIFGFYPNKQITTGEGGILVTDDDDLARMARSMADQGRGDGGWLSHVRMGFNYRMDELSAALGLSQLRRLPEIVQARARVAASYLAKLHNVDGIELPTVSDEVEMSWFVFVIRLAMQYEREDRDHVLARLRAAGIGCRDYFQPIHLQPFIQESFGTARGQFPETERVSDRSIALPFYNTLGEDELEYIVSKLEEALG